MGLKKDQSDSERKKEAAKESAVDRTLHYINLLHEQKATQFDISMCTELLAEASIVAVRENDRLRIDNGLERLAGISYVRQGGLLEAFVASVDACETAAARKGLHVSPHAMDLCKTLRPAA